MSSPHPAYDALTALHTRLHRLSHLQSICWWDQACQMPAKGRQARADALSEVATLMHGLSTQPQWADCLKSAEQEPLDDWQRANLREMWREWRRDNALPASLVEAKTQASSRCEHAWRTQRPANDWKGFLENFRPVLRIARQEAALLGEQAGLRPYDALMDRYEPGMRSDTVQRLFDDVKSWLPDLVARVTERQRRAPRIALQGPFPVAAQRSLSLEVMQLLQFDFQAGRLDESAHPFSGGVPEDVRLTTRYREDDFLPSLMGTIHETGHARYEQERPRAWIDQPVSQARSMALHESQSLSFEMQLGRSAPFLKRLAPLIERHLGSQPAFEPQALQACVQKVEPGLIRVDADEVTYPAHVILRFEIERALIEGDIEAEDIPALWDEAMQRLLGLDTRGNYKDGCLQDVHWPEGLFGYFPCYSLGAMYAAQWFAAMRRDMPGMDEGIARGELSPVFDWLRERIWSQGSRWTTEELAVRASGEPLNPAYLRAHLERRYLG